MYLFAGLGHYLKLPETYHKPSSRAHVSFPYIDTTTKCMEFFYFSLGSAPGRLSILSKNEELHEAELWNEVESASGQWRRVFVKLAFGVNHIVIVGIRSSKGTSGMLLDDITIADCGWFGMYTPMQ